ncbi:MAG TPA: hypothetical protein VF994_09035 [Myxococcales bacterium]
MPDPVDPVLLLEPVSPDEPLLPVELPMPEELPEPLLLVSPVDELPLPVDPEVSLAPASEVLLLGVVGPLRPCAFELRLVEPELPGVALEPASESVVP